LDYRNSLFLYCRRHCCWSYWIRWRF